LYELAVSPVHFVEIQAIKNIVERTELLFILKKYGKDTRANKIKALQRAEELYASSFGVADAAHLAYAETAAGSFVTCDDKLVKKSKMVNVGVDVVTPQEFCIREDLR
jgi:predicted nucleic acid-binding protein